MSEITLNLGNKIRMLREIKGISQENLAGALNLSQQAYRKIEDGSTKLTIDRAAAISKELEIELDTLLNFHPSNVLYKTTNSNIINTNNYYLSEKLIENYENQITYLKTEIERLNKKLEQQ